MNSSEVDIPSGTPFLPEALDKKIHLISEEHLEEYHKIRQALNSIQEVYGRIESELVDSNLESSNVLGEERSSGWHKINDTLDKVEQNYDVDTRDKVKDLILNGELGEASEMLGGRTDYHGRNSFPGQLDRQVAELERMASNSEVSDEEYEDKFEEVQNFIGDQYGGQLSAWLTDFMYDRDNAERYGHKFIGEIESRGVN